MTDVAKLARELKIGNVLVGDVLPDRVIQTLTPTGEIIVVRSAGVQGAGSYEETFARDRVVTIHVPD